MIWLVFAVIFLVVELLAPALISIWFVIGSLAAAISGLLGLSFMGQIVVFLVTSLIFLLVARKLVSKILKKDKIEKTNKDAIVGQKGIVTEEIDNLRNVGRIKLSGVYWTVYSDNDEIIEVDSIVEILEVNGVKLKVKRGER